MQTRYFVVIQTVADGFGGLGGNTHAKVSSVLCFALGHTAEPASSPLLCSPRFLQSRI